MLCRLCLIYYSLSSSVCNRNLVLRSDSKIEKDFLMFDRESEGSFKSTYGFFDNDELPFKTDIFYFDGVFLEERRKAL